MNNLLAFEAVSLVRGGRLLFERMNFAIGPGEALHVVGPNGSGKSSLIRLAAGLLSEASGQVRRDSAIALADDHLALDRELPLGQALRFWSSGPAGDALAAAGIADLERVPVRLLSSGQRKRATLARTYASGAPLWLLDEPLNALDAEGAEQLNAAISNHRSSGGAVLAASHGELTGDWRRVALA